MNISSHYFSPSCGDLLCFRMLNRFFFYLFCGGSWLTEMLLLVKIKHLFKLGRLGVSETSLLGEEADERDMVELEKRNVLLLGPTGSGIS